MIKEDTHNCESGVWVTLACNHCGAECGREHVKAHQRYTTRVIYLADYGGCKGDLRLTSCACGKDSGIVNDMFICNWTTTGEHTETDDNGVEHTITTQTCKKRGLIWKLDSYEVLVDGESQSRDIFTVQTADGQIILEPTPA